MNEKLRDAITERDIFEPVSGADDRARHTLKYLQEVVENDAEVGTASLADMITVLQDLME